MAYFRVLWRRQRKRLTLPELDQYPSTPAAYYDGYYPGSKAVQARRSGFSRKIQNLPELNVYPAAPILTVFVATIGNGTNRTRFERKLLTAKELNLYPVTPAVVPYPAFLQPGIFKSAFERRRLALPELNTFTATPAGYYSGYFPGSKAVQAKYSVFSRARQALPELNVYPAAIVTAPLPAYQPTGYIKRAETNRKLISALVAHVYPATPAGYYSGYFPGSIATRSFKTRFERYRLTIDHSGIAAVTGAVSVTVPTTPGLEYTFPDNRLHYTFKSGRLHYELPENRLHYTMPNED